MRTHACTGKSENICTARKVRRYDRDVGAASMVSKYFERYTANSITVDSSYGEFFKACGAFSAFRLVGKLLCVFLNQHRAETGLKEVHLYSGVTFKIIHMGADQ